ncbi:hypothetical protein GFS31_09880 [Leptolyngbya sp. BL0902]|nr:hypothetical protein [Leptolyngbya sp. BL0902]QQE64308.1 hypothetical protein GFS31_09880 [Leptolyngbya sp. BL0902]
MKVLDYQILQEFLLKCASNFLMQKFEPLAHAPGVMLSPTQTLIFVLW